MTLVVVLGLIAQWLEHLPVEQEVTGSSPVGAAELFDGFVKEGDMSDARERAAAQPFTEKEREEWVVGIPNDSNYRYFKTQTYLDALLRYEATVVLLQEQRDTYKAVVVAYVAGFDVASDEELFEELADSPETIAALKSLRAVMGLQNLLGQV